MSAAKAKVKRRHKYCPVCEEEVAMSVTREAQGENDLWWLLCPTCDSKFGLTSPQYRERKNRELLAIKKNDAKKYATDQVYSIGDLIYHPKLDDMGLVLSKSILPSVDCLGSITVSFIKIGPKTLIEGYAKA